MSLRPVRRVGGIAVRQADRPESVSTIQSDRDQENDERGSGELDDACKERLRAEVGEDIYSSWFARMDLEAMEDGTVRLSVPTRFLKSWIQSHYAERVLACWQAENRRPPHRADRCARPCCA